MPVVQHGSWGGRSPLPWHAAPSVVVEQDNLRHIGSMLLQHWAVHPTHPLREFSPQTTQELLPECLIYHMAIESFDKLDLSYFVIRAWVDDPNEVPTKMLSEAMCFLPRPAHACLPLARFRP